MHIILLIITKSLLFVKYYLSFLCLPYITFVVICRNFNNFNLNAIKIVPGGIISLLEEPMPELKVFALKKLDMIVDEFWPEISEAIEKMYVERKI